MTQQEPKRRSSASLQHQAEHTRTRRRISVMGYLLVLFAAAFLLLLLAYFQQQRINTDTNNALQQSVSAVQSIQNLMTDNETLRSQVADLEEQVETLTARSQELADTMEKQTRAMDLFWQVDEAYVRGRYVLCRQLIQSLEDLSDGAPLKSYLPTESTTDNDRFSPAERYQEIFKAVF